MAHINQKIDTTVGAFIVYDDKVLLINHKKLKKWLPVGGHIELEEDPEEALFREIEEESGIRKEDLEVYGKKPDFSSEGTKFLYAPSYLDIHVISETHKHVGMVYFVKSRTEKISLAEKEHDAIKWFKKEELHLPEYNLTPAVKFYALEAIKVLEG